MARGIGIVLQWVGRLSVVGAIYVLVCAFFLPAGVQFLNPLVCTPGLELDNARYSGPFEPDNQRLELVCTSTVGSTSAAQKVFLIAATMVASGLGAIYLSSKFLRKRQLIPGGPPIR